MSLQLVNFQPPRYVYAETFESETIVEILKTADDELRLKWLITLVYLSWMPIWMNYSMIF